MTTKIKNDVYLKDKVVSILFTSKDTREYTESVIAASLGIPKAIVKDNLTLLTPRINSNINTQYSEVDALYENNTSIINIEINYIDYKTLNVKNMKYVCHLLLEQTKINKKYVALKPVYQICINNFDVFKENKFVYKSYLMEESLHKKRNDLISIIDINVDFLRDIDYTEIMKGEENSLERLLYIFVCNDKEVLNKLYLGDDIMKKVVEKVSSLTENFADELYYDKQQIINDYSYDLGKKDGVQSSKIEMAKKMIEMKMNTSDVAKVTGLTKEDLEKLK